VKVYKALSVQFLPLFTTSDNPNSQSSFIMAPLATLLSLAFLPTLLATPLTHTTPQRKLCIVPASGDGKTDDTPGFQNVVTNCSSDATIQFAAGKD
jgi:hypothetical protein